MIMIKDRQLNAGDRVFVYYNLHKKCFSVKNLKSGLVVAHTNDITLEDITFKVNKKGRERVLREQRKNVHAGVVGLYTTRDLSTIYSGRASYSPYLYDYFYEIESQEPLFRASAVRLKDKKIYFQGEN